MPRPTAWLDEPSVTDRLYAMQWCAHMEGGSNPLIGWDLGWELDQEQMNSKNCGILIQFGFWWSRLERYILGSLVLKLLIEEDEV